ncbi:succinate dehydrogenase, hydrophobic membrane anchor protein [Pseudothauera rhizosphaerae]|uniref:Succinate dehydrogenase hydrophobic membrane anchor subunit n=1 Tax=Pseudothauera rhizosphaerae TaxID=2565932 RepID=A0A4S4AC14_9RHOO|nr:succinate dehydrogenase, hydrophobic membrane anchor protein [Pseudothauera rhizosphaerae]THF56564.1 succinate dehydrogenase, hydrophobic membrane anchor protein [Pseudothauera rhizosphaerae]
MVNRKIVGAHYGLKDWIAQRATAVYMALYTVVFAICALTLPELSHEAWSGLFANGPFKFLSFLFFLSVFYHAWIGVRDIWMDYVKPDGLRLALHLVTLFLLIGYAGWAAQILWRL